MSGALLDNEPCAQLLDYAYDELDEAGKRAFEQHLAGCARCRDELKAFGRVHAATARLLPAVEPPAALTGALHAQLMHAAAQRQPRRGGLLQFPRKLMAHPGWAAAATFVIVGSVFTLNFVRGRLAMPVPAVSPPPPPAAAGAPAPGSPAAPLAQQASGNFAADAEYRRAAAAPARAKKKGVALDRATALPKSPAPSLEAEKRDTFAEAGKAAPAAEAQSSAPVVGSVTPASEPSRKAAPAGAPTRLAVPAKSRARGQQEAVDELSGGGGPVVARSPAPAKVKMLKEESALDGVGADRSAAPAQQPAAAAPMAAAAPTSSLAPREERGDAQVMAAKPKASFGAARAASWHRRADELQRAHRCAEAVKLYGELERAGQLAPAERERYVSCLVATARPQQARQQLDALKADPAASPALVSAAEAAVDGAGGAAKAKPAATLGSPADRAPPPQPPRAAEPEPAPARR